MSQTLPLYISKNELRFFQTESTSTKENRRRRPQAATFPFNTKSCINI